MHEGLSVGPPLKADIVRSVYAFPRHDLAAELAMLSPDD